jgi:hypothetical protein
LQKCFKTDGLCYPGHWANQKVLKVTAGKVSCQRRPLPFMKNRFKTDGLRYPGHWANFKALKVTAWFVHLPKTTITFLTKMLQNRRAALSRTLGLTSKYQIRSHIIFSCLK